MRELKGKNMVSKELLIAVLDENNLADDIFVTNNNIYYAYRKDNQWINSVTNIYEFANKCKYYCCSSFDIKLYSEVRKDDCRCCVSKNRDGEIINKQIIGKTEPEAIFKATEWVLRFKGIK